MDTVKKYRGGDGRSGFTLIELAIVLIIIGLIIGAVLKGQDLITNARAKRFTSFVRQTEVAQWTYYDRNGAFATNGSGTVNSLTSINDYSSTITLGSSIFQVLLSAAQTTDIPLGIAFVKNSAGTVALNEEEAVWAQILDTSIDGAADATSGKIVDIGTITLQGTDGSFNDYTNSTSTAWGSTAFGIMYLFDQ